MNKIREMEKGMWYCVLSAVSGPIFYGRFHSIEEGFFIFDEWLKPTHYGRYEIRKSKVMITLGMQYGLIPYNKEDIENLTKAVTIEGYIGKNVAVRLSSNTKFGQLKEIRDCGLLGAELVLSPYKSKKAEGDKFKDYIETEIPLFIPLKAIELIEPFTSSLEELLVEMSEKKEKQEEDK